MSKSTRVGRVTGYSGANGQPTAVCVKWDEVPPLGTILYARTPEDTPSVDVQSPSGVDRSPKSGVPDRETIPAAGGGSSEGKRECTCIAVCRGAEGLGPNWFCRTARTPHDSARTCPLCEGPAKRVTEVGPLKWGKWPEVMVEATVTWCAACGESFYEAGDYDAQLLNALQVLLRDHAVPSARGEQTGERNFLVNRVAHFICTALDIPHDDERVSAVAARIVEDAAALRARGEPGEAKDSVGRSLSEEMRGEVNRLWALVEAEAERRAIECEMGVGEWEAFVAGVVDRVAAVLTPTDMEDDDG